MSRQLQDEEIIIGHRIKPMTRYERQIQTDRDFMEKQRLKERKENFERYSDPAKIADEGLDEHTRFGENVEDLERERRRIEKEKKEMFWEARGRKADEREKQREEAEKKRLLAEQERLAQLRQRGNVKNESGIPYNILTHNYRDNEEGRYLKQRDEMAYQAVEKRKEDLAKRGGLGYNLLTGEKYKLLQETSAEKIQVPHQIEPKRELPPPVTRDLIDEPPSTLRLSKKYYGSSVSNYRTDNSLNNNTNFNDNINTNNNYNNGNGNGYNKEKINNEHNDYDTYSRNKNYGNNDSLNDPYSHSEYVPSSNRSKQDENCYNRKRTRVINGNSSDSNNFF